MSIIGRTNRFEKSFNEKARDLEILTYVTMKILRFIDRKILIYWQSTLEEEGLQTKVDYYEEKGILIDLMIQKDIESKNAIEHPTSVSKSKGVEIYLTRTGKLIEFQMQSQIPLNLADGTNWVEKRLTDPSVLSPVETLEKYPDFGYWFLRSVQNAIARAIMKNPNKRQILEKTIEFLNNIDLTKKKEDDFLDLIERDPRNAKAHAEYANYLWMELFDPRTAEQQYKYALRFDASDALIRVDYAKYLTSQKRFEEATQHFQKAIEIDPENHKVYGEWADSWMYDYFENVKTPNFRPKPEETEKFENLYRKSFALDSKDYYYHVGYGFFCFWIKRERDGQLTQTKQEFEKAIQLNPENIGVIMNYTGLLMLKNDPDLDKIEQLLLKANSLKPEDAGIVCQLADFYASTKKELGKAEEFYLKAIEMKPYEGWFKMNLADFYVKQKDFSNAERLYEEAIKITSEKDQTLFIYLTGYANCLFLADKIDEGLNAISRVVVYYYELQKQNTDDNPQNLRLRAETLRFIYSLDLKDSKASNQIIQRLLKNGSRLEELESAYQIETHVIRGIARGHPEPEYLKKLIQVILGKKPLEFLEKK